VSRSHEDWKHDLAPYALGALDEPERRALEGHLHDCRHCREELAWLRPAIDVLGMSAEPVRAPARLRRNLIATVRAEDASRENVAQRRGRIAGFSIRPAIGFAAVLAALVAGALGYTVGDDAGSRPTTTPLQVNSDTPGGARGELISNGQLASLQLHDLPPVHGDGVYQAWIRREELIEPSTVFVPDAGGDAFVAIPGLQEADEVMVTREPNGGSRKPSTGPIFRASLS
jgi:hypothetical protein